MEGEVLITALYAGILGVIMVLLSLRVIVVARAGAHIPYGDGGKDELTPVVRAQGNFAEYVPLALLLIGYLEFIGSPATLIHGLGASLVVARILHPLGLRPNQGPSVLRVIGTVATLLVLLTAAIAAIMGFSSGA